MHDAPFRGQKADYVHVHLRTMQLEIDEKINCLRWCKPVNSAFLILTTNGESNPIFACCTCSKQAESHSGSPAAAALLEKIFVLRCIWYLKRSCVTRIANTDKTIKLWRVQDRKRPVAIVDSYSDKVCVCEMA
jgi:hypothetical protein